MAQKMLDPSGTLYVRGADGAFFLEVPQPDGEMDYLPAEKGLSFQELPNGKFMAVRDMREAERAREGSSHLRYFESLKQSADPKQVRQTLKRQESLQRQFEQMAIDRVDPGGSPDVKQLKDGEFMRLTEQYAQACRERRQGECEFQPVQAYQHKLVTKSGKIVRPLLKGEVGMIGSTILVLEAGFGTGNFVSVPEEVGVGSDGR